MSDDEKAESVYERARNELDLEECDCETCENLAHHEAVLSAITCGELEIARKLKAVEKRAVEAEKEIARLIDTLMGLEQNEAALWNEIHNALALLKPARPEDGLLPAIRDVLQRLVLAEKEPDDDGDQ
jgi:hypothetical protein